jgi:hypothetical protein
MLVIPTTVNNRCRQYGLLVQPSGSVDGPQKGVSSAKRHLTATNVKTFHTAVQIQRLFP